MDRYEAAAHHVRGVWAVVHAFWDGVWLWLHNGVIIRRGTLVFSGYMTLRIVEWMGEFIERAHAAGMSGMEISAIVAAVGTPIGILQGAIFKFYSEGRKEVSSKPTQS